MFAVLVGAILLVVILLWLIQKLKAVRWRRPERSSQPAIDRCICGYELTGLELARCPECGRVRGFNASADELGLTDEQLFLIEQKRRERERQSADIRPTSPPST